MRYLENRGREVTAIHNGLLFARKDREEPFPWDLVRLDKYIIRQDMGFDLSFNQEVFEDPVKDAHCLSDEEESYLSLRDGCASATRWGFERHHLSTTSPRGLIVTMSFIESPRNTSCVCLKNMACAASEVGDVGGDKTLFREGECFSLGAFLKKICISEFAHRSYEQIV